MLEVHDRMPVILQRVDNRRLARPRPARSCDPLGVPRTGAGGDAPEAPDQHDREQPSQRRASHHRARLLPWRVTTELKNPPG